MGNTILILLALMLGIVLFGCDFQGTQRTYPTASNFDLYTIHDLKGGNFTSGNFNVEGYVVKIYTCPQCPQDASCKPCMKDNIVLSENNDLLEAYSLTENELVVFSNNTGQFKLGGKYRFSITIGDRKTTGEPINDIELIGYDSIG